MGQIYLDTYRTKEKRVKAIALCGTAVEILRKVKAEAKATGPDDPVFGRGDGRPIKFNGLPWKEGLHLGDTARPRFEAPEARTDGFLDTLQRPSSKRIGVPSLRPVTGISFNQIMKQENISNRTLKAIEASMKNGDPIPEAQPAIEPWTI